MTINQQFKTARRSCAAGRLSPEAATARNAHRTVDQPALKGAPNHQQPTTLHSKFMKPGVAKSLTRSAPSHTHKEINE